LIAPWDVIFFATDGLHALKELGVESPTKTLGGREKKELKAGIWAQPGVYAFSTLDRGKTEFTGRSRGMSPGAFLGDDQDKTAEDAVVKDRDERLYDFYDENLVPLWARGGGRLTIPLERYVTFGFATSSEANWALAGCWLETSRVLDANSGGKKRERCSDKRRATGVVPLVVKANPTPDELSAPHEPEWLDDRERIEHDWREDMKGIAAARLAEPDDCGVDVDN
jgi:hypothetical protein